eukprot:gene8720-52_t
MGLGSFVVASMSRLRRHAGTHSTARKAGRNVSVSAVSGLGCAYFACSFVAVSHFKQSAQTRLPSVRVIPSIADKMEPHAFQHYSNR